MVCVEKSVMRHQQENANIAERDQEERKHEKERAIISAVVEMEEEKA